MYLQDKARIPSRQDSSILPARAANHSVRFGSSCLLTGLDTIKNCKNYLKNYEIKCGKHFICIYIFSNLIHNILSIFIQAIYLKCFNPFSKLCSMLEYRQKNVVGSMHDFGEQFSEFQHFKFFNTTTCG